MTADEAHRTAKLELKNRRDTLVSTIRAEKLRINNGMNRVRSTIANLKNVYLEADQKINDGLAQTANRTLPTPTPPSHNAAHLTLIRDLAQNPTIMQQAAER